MTKDVLIAIAGLQTGQEGDGALEMVSAGSYAFQNGKHFIRYEEVQEIEGREPIPVKCMIKFTKDCVEVVKKGPTAVQMIFECGKTHMTYYTTPYGNLLLGITTKNIVLKETEDSMRVQLCYGLDMNYQFVADCKLDIKIVNK